MIRKALPIAAILFLFSLPAFTQCTTSDATTCVCEDGVSTDCDLLPDIKIGLPPLLISGNQGIIEYSQSGNGADNGRLRISVSSPNIGAGPLTVKTTSTFICGTDTFVGTAPSVCANGDPPKVLVNQRVYHKNGSQMTYYDRPAGTMTYHPTHSHMHIDDWGIYTLRDSTPGVADPLLWPIIGTGSKLAFCLMDYGSCSFYAGHCADDNGNTMLNSDFPNWGLGGGNYNCTPIEQGISSGYTDIYYQYLDGMWINIPPGTCNGDYHLVVQLDPYDYFLESNENNNVVAVPITLTEQVPATGQATITSQGSTAICNGKSLSLVASSGTGFLWSTGATTQSINVSQAGSYSVTVNSACGNGTSAPISVSIINPVISSTQGASVPAGTSAILSAVSSGSDVNWYDAASGGNLLHTGPVFTTPVLNSSQTYYAEAVHYSQSNAQFSAPHNNTIGNGANHNDESRFLIFDCFTPLVLESVKVYASSAGMRTIELRDDNDLVLDSISVFVPFGESRVALNMTVQPASDLRLGLAAGTTAGLFRNNSGVNYPYSVNGFIDIKGSSAGSSYYYFFYDWEVRSVADTCRSSSRSPVMAQVTVGIEENESLTDISLYPNPASDYVLLLFNSGLSEPSMLQVFDVSGRLVYEQRLTERMDAEEVLNVDLSNLEAGIYVMQISNNKGILSKRFSLL